MQNNFRKFEELVFCNLWFPVSRFRILVSDSGFWFPIPDSGFLVLGLPTSKQKYLPDLITALLKFNCFLSTAVAMQCTFQSVPWWFIDYCRHHITSSTQTVFVISDCTISRSRCFTWLIHPGQLLTIQCMFTWGKKYQSQHNCRGDRSTYPQETRRKYAGPFAGIVTAYLADILYNPRCLYSFRHFAIFLPLSWMKWIFSQYFLRHLCYWNFSSPRDSSPTYKSKQI